jgi:hypothetical protein
MKKRLAGVALLACAACGDSRGDPAPTATSSASAATIASAAAPSASASASVTASAALPPPKPRPALPDEDVYPKTLDEQRAEMLKRMQVMLELDDAKIAAVKAILDKSEIIGQGNPAVVTYAMTRKECRERREAAHVVDVDDPICGAPLMAPLWDPKAGESAKDAKACIDRYEFPGVPCDYPVTWVSPRDAAALCEAIGKRICDAHEWEGACAGAVLPPEKEYAFGKPRKEMKVRHNSDRERVWAYGAERDLKKCGTGSKKSKTCEKSGWKKCGSNTYPDGSFPECRSSFGVYDQHGNVAEHMNMPMKLEELASRGGKGETEMKGSWFIFQGFDAHEDDCRWRAPDWHATKLDSFDGHANYHLGFRCCKNVETPGNAPAPVPAE